MLPSYSNSINSTGENLCHQISIDSAEDEDDNCEALTSELKPLWHTFRKGRLSYNFEQCLYITLWKLGNSGVTFRQLSDRFNVAKGAVHKIFYKTVKAICRLKREISWPSVSQQKTVMERFQNSRETHFPFVIGCLDGIHLKIPRPRIDSISYYNRKGFFSINMLFYDALTDIWDDATECITNTGKSLNISLEQDNNSLVFDGKPITLEKAVEEAQLAICYFFNNKFDAARALMTLHAHYSMYHAIGRAVFSFLEAILTFEQQHIIKAGEELRTCIDVCQRQKRKATITQSIGKKFKRANYNHLSDTEAHAELCTAEALLLRALLTFIEDETLSSLIRGGMKIRQCYNSYKECVLILNNREWESGISRIHFESGVRMGMGAFNLMISLLPAGVVKVLEFIGFSGKKDGGLKDLQIGYNLPGLRQVLCAMTLLGYHLIVCYVLSHQEGDLAFANEILTSQLLLYPQGVWFLFFKGRLEFMLGNLDEAQVWYKKSWKSQNVWPQFHHLSFWELLWVNCLRLDWREASLYATYLVENSKWSRTIYSFQKAAVMLMLPNLTSAEKLTISNLMRDCPAFKQRIAGKSLPMEKFICKKAERYFAQGETLCLPAIELMYLWNMFKVMSKQHDIAYSIYRLIEEKMNDLERNTDCSVYDNDNKALCLLLRGACMRQMRKPALALQDLKQCIDLYPLIKEDFFLVAYARVECGLVYADENNIDLAINILEETKKIYTGFSLESRLHFRIHTALMDLKERKKTK